MHVGPHISIGAVFAIFDHLTESTFFISNYFFNGFMLLDTSPFSCRPCLLFRNNFL